MAHKVILSARCEYFKRIFNSGFRESSGSTRTGDVSYIPIRGTQSDIFLAMLEYVYTGRVASKENTLSYEVGVYLAIHPKEPYLSPFLLRLLAITTLFVLIWWLICCSLLIVSWLVSYLLFIFKILIFFYSVG